MQNVLSKSLFKAIREKLNVSGNQEKKKNSKNRLRGDSGNEIIWHKLNKHDENKKQGGEFKRIITF